MAERYTWGSLRPDQISELNEVLDGGDQRFQHYNETLRITGWPDCDEAWIAWSQMAFIALTATRGRH